jgi:hypothetical protein
MDLLAERSTPSVSDVFVEGLFPKIEPVAPETLFATAWPKSDVLPVVAPPKRGLFLVKL